MMGTACRSPLGGHQRVLSAAAAFTVSSMISAAPMKVAATNQAFADPLVATTEAFVRAGCGGFHD
jgi:hypothetical protein